MIEYPEEYHKSLTGGSMKSAREIVPLVLELIKPESVIDVGCGIGAWLLVFKELGIEDIFGVDGDWVNKSALLIPRENFLFANLEKPLKIDRKFDLAVSLEVAEHLSKEAAETFVDSLTCLAPVVLFSAAIPLQGDIYHLNEQWPDYWSKLFKNKSYVVIDCLRKKIWNNENVKYWYVQNILIFARKDYLETNLLLLKEFENTNESMLSVVHPKKYLPVAQLGRKRHLIIKKIVPSKLIRRLGKKFLDW